MTKHQTELWRQLVKKENYLRSLHIQRNDMLQQQIDFADLLPFEIVMRQKALVMSDPNTIYNITSVEPIATIRPHQGFEL